MTAPLALIGNIPRLNRVGTNLPADVELHAKAKWYNLGGSVKDRLAMIRAGERHRLLRVARELRAGVAATMRCDSASRYRSERFWEEDSLIAGDGM